MVKRFGKTRHGMHMINVTFKNNEKQLAKRTYNVFIGKAPPDAGTVIPSMK